MKFLNSGKITVSYEKKTDTFDEAVAFVKKHEEELTGLVSYTIEGRPADNDYGIVGGFTASVSGYQK